MPSGTLYTATLNLVRNRPVHMTYDKIAELCRSAGNADVTSSWLRLFATERCRSPEVDKVQSVYECLSGTKLI